MNSLKKQHSHLGNSSKKGVEKKINLVLALGWVWNFECPPHVSLGAPWFFWCFLLFHQKRALLWWIEAGTHVIWIQKNDEKRHMSNVQNPVDIP